jgi:type IV pilus assembly protein PilY1
MTYSFINHKILPTVIAALSLCSVSVEAVVTVLADAPPLNVSTVKPNFMFTLDNSGSMQSVYVPDNFAGNVGKSCFKNSVANPLYFDPTDAATKVTYPPPKSYIGATDTTIDLPDAPFIAAPWDGFNIVANWRDNIGAGWFTTNLPLNLNNAFRANYEYSSGVQASDLRQGAYYFKYTGAAPAVPVPGTCYADASYTRVDVTAENAMVKQNFANWFSYYRSRMQAIKTAAGAAFSDLNKSEYRVGFHTINNFGANYLNVLDYAGINRENWYKRFYSITPSGGTPSRASHIRIGEYFRGNGTANGLPGSIDPLQQSCQGNFHFLSTDGYWNEADPAFAPGDQDDTVPVLPSAVAGLTTGIAWPKLYRQSTAAATGGAIKSPTLSDIATYYWATDLRTGMANNVPTSVADPANWQHLVLYGVSIAATGTLPYDFKDSTVAAQTLADIADIAKPLTWPNPINNSPSAIDDLWHATVNSRGKFFNVGSAQQLASALAEALADASSRSGTAAGAALGDANLAAATGDNLIYVPSYKSGQWTGELVAKRLDPATGLVTGADVWKHSTILDAQSATTGWDTARKILTSANGTTVPLRLGALTAAQKLALGSPLVVAPTIISEQQAVLNYLRGDKTNESQTSATSFKFRERTTRLGDIIDSEPVAVTTPIQPFAESYNPGYQAFKAANLTRTPMVYFGANDGLIHAVNGEAASADAGKEIWAYMPSFLFRSDATGVVSLTYKATDLAPKKFTHHFYVNGPMYTRDVDFKRTSQVSAAPTPSPSPATQIDWHTVLIGGMGKGGNGYVALDVTAPPATTSTEATIASANKVLWEFTDPDMGFTYGQPLIFKTRRFGWVAALTSGYNNVTGTNAGKGIVYIVDVKTGTLLHKFITTDGSASNPIGLAHIEAFVPDFTDFTATEIYGGDLLGNVWRFDISGTTAYAAGGVKFAQLRDSSNQPQPITTYPVPYADPVTGTRFVGVGTGKLLNVADITDYQQQTVYNFRDGDIYTPKSTGLPLTRSNLQSVARTTNVANLTSAADGWYQDLVAGNGERVVKPLQSAFGVLIAFTITPSTDPCDPGAFGTAYARTGISGDNAIDPSSGQTFLGGTAGSPQFVGSRVVKLSDGTPVVQVLSSGAGGNGTISTLNEIKFPGGFEGTVVNYREIIE